MVVNVLSSFTFPKSGKKESRGSVVGATTTVTTITAVLVLWQPTARNVHMLRLSSTKLKYDHFQVLYFNFQQCVNKCPEEKPFLGEMNGKTICSEEDLNAIRNRRRTVATVTSLTVGLAVVLIIIIIIYKCRRLGRKLEKVRNENLADIPEEVSDNNYSWMQLGTS